MYSGRIVHFTACLKKFEIKVPPKMYDTCLALLIEKQKKRAVTAPVHFLIVVINVFLSSFRLIQTRKVDLKASPIILRYRSKLKFYANKYEVVVVISELSEKVFGIGFSRVPHPTPLEGADPDSDEEPDNPEEAEREFFHTQFHVRRNQVPVLTGTRKEELLKIREIFKKMIDKFGSTLMLLPIANLPSATAPLHRTNHTTVELVDFLSKEVDELPIYDADQNAP